MTHVQIILHHKDQQADDGLMVHVYGPLGSHRDTIYLTWDQVRQLGSDVLKALTSETH